MNILFDWSGTIANDQELTWDLTNKTIQYFSGPNISFKTYQEKFRFPINDFYLEYCPNTPIEKIDEFFFTLYYQSISDVLLFKDAVNILSHLKTNNKLFIVSSLDKKILDGILIYNKINFLFTDVIGGASSKSTPLKHLVEKYNLFPAESIYIGDMPHDVESGKLNYLQTGAATFGYSKKEKFTPLNPDYYFDDLLSIKDHFDSINQVETLRWPIVTVGGLIFNDNNQFLLVQTSKWSNLFGTPGGKVDYGESLEDAFRREIMEETGLEINKIQYIFYQDCINHPEFYKPKHFILMNYIAKTKTQNVKLNYESQKYVWVTYAESKKLPLNEPTKNLITELKKTGGYLYEQ